MCAESLHSKSALGAYCRRICARIGTPKGLTATAHKLARRIYRMLKYGESYVDIGQEAYEQKYKNRLLQNLRKRAHELGLVLIEPAALPQNSPAPQQVS